MANLSSLAPITTAATGLSNLILVSPQSVIGYQPQNPPTKDGQPTQQPGAFLFHYEGEQTVSLESDITDHYVEDNTAVQDQIALKPETLTTHGFIGELNDVAPYGLQTIKTIADKLTIVSAYSPVLSITAQTAYTEAFFAYQIGLNAVNAAVSAWSSINQSGAGESFIGSNGITVQNNQTKQQTAFQQFYGYWRNRTLFTVQTPWAVFQNMAILSIRAVQDADTDSITDFDIRFKMIRKASTASLFEPIPQGRSSRQSEGLTDLGTQTPTTSIGLTDGLNANYPASFGTALG